MREKMRIACGAIFLFHRKLCSYEIKKLRADRTAAAQKMAALQPRRRRRILRSRILFLFTAGWILFFSCGRETGASVFERINAPKVFLKQEEPSSCTLCAAAMMLRRAAILSKDCRWEQVDEKSLKKEAWIKGQGLRHSFSFQNGGKTYRVRHETLPGGEENREILISLLKEHPEGIVLYHGPGEKQHAVLLTDDTDGIFYCADPCEEKPKGRILLEQAVYVTVENANAFWYVVQK